jgi:hypothetical protein
MQRRILLFSSFSIVLIGLTLVDRPQNPFDTEHFRPEESLAVPALPSIAHAGGEIGGVSESNSIDALEANKQDYDLLELDFSWTADGQLVCLHDWDEGFAARFGYIPEQPITLAEFQKSLEDGGLQNCTLATLAGWIRANPEKRIVTDIKQDNLRGLKRIAEAHPDLLAHFVPQAYFPEEIAAIKALGYPEVIWTLYRFSGSTADVLQHLRSNEVLAVTMPKERALAGAAWAIQERASVPSYVHTVNNPLEAGCFAAFGLSGIYTDSLGGVFPEERPGDRCRVLFSFERAEL